MIRWFDVVGIGLLVGMTTVLSTTFFLIYTGVSSNKINLNMFGEAGIEAVLIPIVLIWGLISLVRIFWIYATQ